MRIRDVADRAQVSVSTVSVVLNDVPAARVSPDTRRRVLAAARELGHPAVAAGSAAPAHARTLGMLTDLVVTTPSAGRMVQGAQDAAWRSGYLILLAHTGVDPAVEARAVSALRQQADGVLYATVRHREVRLPAPLTSRAAVILNAVATSASVPFVVPDDRSGALEAVVELLRLGHRRIGLVTADEHPVGSRHAGYAAALTAAGVAYDPALVITGEASARGGCRASLQLLSAPQPPTAILCYDDRMAAGAYRAARARGLHIPTDLSIIGFDDQDLISGSLDPELTTVALPYYAMGEWAASALLRLIEGRGPRAAAEGVMMPCPLVRRGSAGPPPR